MNYYFNNLSFNMFPNTTSLYNGYTSTIFSAPALFGNSVYSGFGFLPQIFNTQISAFDSSLIGTNFSFNPNNSIFNWSMPSFSFTGFNFGNIFPSQLGISSSYTSTKTSSGKAPHWSKMDDSEMRKLYGNYDYDITTKSNITAEQINKFIETKYPTSILKGKGQVFIDAQEKYGISALAMLGICGIETTYGTADNVKKGNNNVVNIEKPEGATYSGRWRKFDSVDDCIMELARLLKENYVDSPGNGKVKHLTKLYQVNAKYCPSGETSKNAVWASKVQDCMNNVQKTINA